jgi:hypothetical protein
MEVTGGCGRALERYSDSLNWSWFLIRIAVVVPQGVRVGVAPGEAWERRRICR